MYLKLALHQFRYFKTNLKNTVLGSMKAEK
jgi:hypothetical protein